MLGAWPEPFGLVAIESLATGTPVIARRAGALPELVTHGVDGFLVDDIAEAALAVRLARDLDRTRIRERALARFNPERMVEDYEQVYRRLVADARAGLRPGQDVHPLPAFLAESPTAGRNHVHAIPTPRRAAIRIAESHRDGVAAEGSLPGSGRSRVTPSID
jgi:hypothetical protein